MYFWRAEPLSLWLCMCEAQSAIDETLQQYTIYFNNALQYTSHSIHPLPLHPHTRTHALPPPPPPPISQPIAVSPGPSLSPSLSPSPPHPQPPTPQSTHTHTHTHQSASEDVSSKIKINETETTGIWKMWEYYRLNRVASLLSSLLQTPHIRITGCFRFRGRVVPKWQLGPCNSLIAHWRTTALLHTDVQQPYCTLTCNKPCYSITCVQVSAL